MSEKTLQNTENIDNPFKGILSAVCFAVRATVHTTLQATPSQLVFGRDHILNIKYQANWKNIRDQKQKLIKEYMPIPVLLFLILVSLYTHVSAREIKADSKYKI